MVQGAHWAKLKECCTILQVSRSPTLDEVKAAYRRLARLYHPDLNPETPTATERFQSVNEAYEILSTHLSTHPNHNVVGVEQPVAKAIHHDREDWLQNEAYLRFISVLR
ncbi:MAG: J domain-containing protein [Stenomitos rutilans HA7619-LM2]|nr:J domain-containing protein [Stenomitos rutilans HA7619-LM2]